MNQSQQLPNYDVTSVIEKAGRKAILGLDEHDQPSYPDDIDSTFPGNDSEKETLSFAELIKFLPDAERGDLNADNQFIDNNLCLDLDEIKETLDIDDQQIDDIANLRRNHSVARDQQSVEDYVDIVDPRREALHALGHDIKFRWQIATNAYTIINPGEAYYPAYRTFKDKGLGNQIFGWVDFRDWGGDVNIYILFKNLTMEIGDHTVYLGLRTGYNFSGTQSLEVSPFGYLEETGARLYHLGYTKKRKHIGDPNDASHERKQNRVPISEWWDNQYERITTWTEDFQSTIKFAMENMIDFDEYDFTLAEFYDYLGIAKTYIRNDDSGPGAVKRAIQYSSPSSEFTIWTIYYALTTTLEREFQGDDYTGAAFKAYAELATEILESPQTALRRVQNEYHEQHGNDDEDTEIDTENVFDRADNPDLTISERLEERQRQQKDIFDFSPEDNNA